MKKLAFAVGILFFAASLAIAIPDHPIIQEGQKSKKIYSGQVVSVDTTKSEMTIKDEEGKEVRLSISPDTKITKGGKEITLADIKPGETVTAECEESAEGCKVVSIEVKST